MKKSALLQIEEELHVSHDGRVEDGKNPMPELMEKELAIPVGNGLFVLKGILVDLIDLIDQKFKQLAKEFDAEPIHVPSFLSRENMEKSQYLTSFLNQALLLTRTDSSVSTSAPASALNEGMACPTVCYHYFASLSQKILNGSPLVTAVAKCSRFEDGVLPDLSRLKNFTMRELIGFGSPELCKESVEKIQTRSIQIFSEFFDLSFRVQTASDPFFGKNEELKKKAQLLSQSKFEIRALLPFSSSYCSIASFNRHGGVFFDRFSIQKKESDVNESFCVGFGYERILFAILCQKGLRFNSDYYKNLLKPSLNAVNN